MQIYSPEQELIFPLFEKKNIRVFVKRDDMIHPFISGNKWRKLKYNIEEARKQHKQTLITFGGAWSNHLLATACAGATFRFRTIAFVRGEEVHNPVLGMCKLFGMELIFVSREAYKDKKWLFEQHPQHDSAYFIDEGGAGALATKGCEELIAELGQDYDHIFCAAGTGTTAAGLSMGLQKNNKTSELHVVLVLKSGGFIADEMKALQAPLEHVKLHLDYHFGGYAKTDEKLLTFVKEFVSTTGLMIEPTYTGKAMYALVDLVRNNQFNPGSKILFIHTGGLTGLLGMLDRFK